ncbi:MAG: DoxX family membrane protein [Ignavibacteria bacterium]|nr:DoxX family membrane protein [Ignavibacteria bacterium]
MKPLLSNDYLVLLTRTFLGLLFVVVSLEKIVEPAAFAQSIANYKIVGPPLTVVLATVLPWLELLCGFALLFGIFLRGSSLLLSGMLVVFTAGVISALLRGLDIACGCFTQDPSVGKIGWMKVLQNGTLLALSVFLYFSSSVRFSISQYLRTRPLG